LLILRAETAAEMNEWLFQLRRSIEVWVRKFMTAHLDLANNNNRISTHGILLSPRYHHVYRDVITAPTAKHSDRSHYLPVLSHGHGRNSLHRRRVLSNDETAAEIQSASLPKQTCTTEDHNQDNHDTGDHDVYLEMDDLDIVGEPSMVTKAGLFTPFMQTTPDEADVQGHTFRVVKPPWVAPTDTRGGPGLVSPTLDDSSTIPFLPIRPLTPLFRLDEEENVSEPELSAPPPPEVQHPLPSKGKYLPPHLRRQQQQQNQQADHQATAKPRMYIPPHLREKQQQSSTTDAVDSHTVDSAATPLTWAGRTYRDAADRNSDKVVARSPSDTLALASPPVTSKPVDCTEFLVQRSKNQPRLFTSK
jgi:hypothetical protein